MKRNLLRFMGLFMAGVVIMQGAFAAGEKAKASHSETGSYSNYGGVTVMIEAGTNKISPCYCIESSVGCGSTGSSTGRTLDANQSLLLNTIFLFGFNANNVTSSTSFTAEQRNLHGTTQSIVWAVTNGRFDGSIASVSRQSSSYDQDLLKKVAYHLAEPTYINDQENELVWNANTNQFELT